MISQSEKMIESVKGFIAVQREMGSVLFDLGLSDDVEAFMQEPLREAGEVQVFKFSLSPRISFGFSFTKLLRKRPKI